MEAAQFERLVTDIEIASRLSISRRHVHVLRSRGQLRAVRLGNAVRFPLNENLARVLGEGSVRGRERGQVPGPHAARHGGLTETRKCSISFSKAAG
jgi:excisionase family DNA binding protein